MFNKFKKNNKIKRLTHIGTGGSKGWIYSINGYSPTLPATQYKDPAKIVVKIEVKNENE